MELFEICLFFLLDGGISESIVTCAPGWTFFPHTGKCYQHVEKSSFVTHTAAEKACESISPVESTGRIFGDLASVPDILTNTFLMRLSENKSVYIGGKRNVNNDWIWSDGTPWNFTAWSPDDEPNNWRGIQFYLSLMKHGTEGWNDIEEDGFRSLFGYICQYQKAGW